MSTHINNKMQNYLLFVGNVTWTANPPPPLTPIVQPTTNNLTYNLSLYLNNQAGADGNGRANRGQQWKKLMTAAAAS